MKKQNLTYSDMTLFQQATYNLATGDRAERVGAARVDAGFFGTLQVAPFFGRVFDAADMQPGKNRVAIISYGLWQTLFGGNSDVLAKTVLLDGLTYRVVGVMPPQFEYPHKSDLVYGEADFDKTQVWSPLALTAEEKANRDDADAWALARMQPGVTLQAAQAELSMLMRRFDLLHAVDRRGWSGVVKPFRETSLGPIRPMMLLMSSAVGFVLLIACGNAANLLLARAADRSHEMGVRATLGAGRGRLLRQMLTEALLLSVAAACAGIALAWLFLRAMLRLNPGDIPRMEEASLDYRVLAFLAGITLLTSVMFGVLPSLLSTRMNLGKILHGSGLRGVVGDRGRVRQALAIAQVAMVVVLLTGAGLLLRSYAKVMAVPAGFSAATVAVHLQLSPPLVYHRRDESEIQYRGAARTVFLRCAGPPSDLARRAGHWSGEYASLEWWAKPGDARCQGIPQCERSTGRGASSFARVFFGDADSVDPGTSIQRERRTRSCADRDCECCAG